MKIGFLLAMPLVFIQLAPGMDVSQTALAQAPLAQSAPSTISNSELEQILAPIALYPDELLTQTLVASTYPLEIVLAARWLRAPVTKIRTAISSPEHWNRRTGIHA